MPKCASTSIEDVLSPYSQLMTRYSPTMKHANFKRYKKYIEPFVVESTGKKPETICLFREPIDWLYSWYKYRQRSKLDGKPKSTRGLSFDEFCIKYMAGDKMISSIGRQAKFVENMNHDIGVDKIFPYENLNLIKMYLEDKIGEKISLPIKNVSPKISEKRLSESVEKELREYLDKDYNIYNTIIKNC
jgi:hypothetical protein